MSCIRWKFASPLLDFISVFLLIWNLYFKLKLLLNTSCLADKIKYRILHWMGRRTTQFTFSEKQYANQPENALSKERLTEISFTPL